MISYEMSRAGLVADAQARARGHFDRAVALTRGEQAAPFVTYAESVAIAERNRAEFEKLLQRALKVDVSAAPDWKLANRVMQRRAQWLLERSDKLFAD
jgi:predicted anti-sigma-YlaC factor YlaD